MSSVFLYFLVVALSLFVIAALSSFRWKIRAVAGNSRFTHYVSSSESYEPILQETSVNDYRPNQFCSNKCRLEALEYQSGLRNRFEQQCEYWVEKSKNWEKNILSKGEKKTLVATLVKSGTGVSSQLF